jgi:hypothetical protein
MGKLIPELISHYWKIPTSVMPSKVSELVRNLVEDIDVLGKYHEDSDYIIGKDLSNKNRLKEDILR